MNILVIVGSPKGKDSITLHTCLYLEKQFPGHESAKMGDKFSEGMIGPYKKAIE